MGDFHSLSDHSFDQTPCIGVITDLTIGRLAKR